MIVSSSLVCSLACISFIKHNFLQVCNLHFDNISKPLHCTVIANSINCYVGCLRLYVFDFVYSDTFLKVFSGVIIGKFYGSYKQYRIFIWGGIKKYVCLKFRLEQRLIKRRMSQEFMSFLGLKDTLDGLDRVSGVRRYGHVVTSDNGDVLRRV